MKTQKKKPTLTCPVYTLPTKSTNWKDRDASLTEDLRVKFECHTCYNLRCYEFIDDDNDGTCVEVCAACGADNLADGYSVKLLFHPDNRLDTTGLTLYHTLGLLGYSCGRDRHGVYVITGREDGVTTEHWVVDTPKEIWTMLRHKKLILWESN